MDYTIILSLNLTQRQPQLEESVCGWRLAFEVSIKNGFYYTSHSEFLWNPNYSLGIMKKLT